MLLKEIELYTGILLFSFGAGFCLSNHNTAFWIAITIIGGIMLISNIFRRVNEDFGN